MAAAYVYWREEQGGEEADEAARAGASGGRGREKDGETPSPAACPVCVDVDKLRVVSSCEHGVICV
jgi:hypothetical protein